MILSSSFADKRELSSLRVLADDDMISARNFVGTHGDRAATGIHRLHRLRDGRHPDIVAPALASARLNSAYRADGRAVEEEEAIFAKFSHRHELIAGPAKQVAVKGAGGSRIGRGQLVPADAARLGDRKNVAHLILVALRRGRFHDV